MPPPILIFGHKNPDPDAICAAIGYAAFKQAQGHSHYVAARCGNSNDRIDAILQHFNVPLPTFIGDVTPRVQDIMIREVHTIGEDRTCAEALDLMDRHDIRALPVLTHDRHIAGLLSIFNLGAFFIPRPNDKLALRRVHTSLADIVRCLNAEVLHSVEPERTEELFVRIGAMDIRSFGRYLHNDGTPANQCVIIVGDRWDIQQKAIQMGVRLIVVTGGHKVESEVLEMAQQRQVSIVVSPHDTASTAWIARTATRLAPMIQREFITFSPDEKLATARRRVANTSAPVFLVVDDQQRLLGLFTKTDLLRPVQKKIVLVDHNEISQAVNGADEVEIAEIIDHHRLGNIPTQHPILFHNEPVGSTCTIVADLFLRNGLTPPQPIAGVLMGGILADTLKLQSPTSTDKDRQILEWLAGLAHEDCEQLAETIFSSGSIILSQSPEQILRSDCKLYEEGQARFCVSQIEELGFDNFWNRWEALMQALEALRKKDNLLFSALLVTDIRTQNSLLLMQGAAECLAAISYPKVRHEAIFDMPGIVSRKKQLIPYLTGMLHDMGLGTSKG